MISTVPLVWLVFLSVGAPACLCLVFGAASLVGRQLPERWTAGLTGMAMTVSCAALVVGLVAHGIMRTGPRLLSFGGWSTSHAGGIAIEFLVDRWSLGFAALSSAIVGIVSAFSNRYLHRDAGYHRYFTLLTMFVTGMLLVALAGNIEVLFIGWELVGLSSALLVGFFHERPAPVANAFRVISIYRVSDAAMLSAAVVLQHAAGSGSLSLLFGAANSGARSSLGLTGPVATAIAILLVVAVAGKSALLPFSSWLPRAMEGPTPSSAVYYGSLSIHAGCFLLLRSAPLLEHSLVARLLAGGLGAGTAIFAGITTRVQSDVKSGLAYAALTQVGLIVVEIAIGWYALAFIHIVGHACLRLFQFLSAPNVLHDLHGMENAMGARPSWASGAIERVGSPNLRRLVFLFALERGFLDSVLDRFVVAPFTAAARRLTQMDRWLCGALIQSPWLDPAAAGEDRDE